jgi:hypothetical protein
MPSLIFDNYGKEYLDMVPARVYHYLNKVGCSGQKRGEDYAQTEDGFQNFDGVGIGNLRGFIDSDSKQCHVSSLGKGS